MDAGRPSRTALVAAAARAAHLVVDGEPWIFEDRLAGMLLGDLAGDLVLAHRDAGQAGVLASMRVAMTTRSRYTEERLAEAVRRGNRQYVLLGAGLDSFAYRSSLSHQLRVFEVDHPATQAWKRERLAAAVLPAAGEAGLPGRSCVRGTHVIEQTVAPRSMAAARAAGTGRQTLLTRPRRFKTLHPWVERVRRRDRRPTGATSDSPPES